MRTNRRNGANRAAAGNPPARPLPYAHRLQYESISFVLANSARFDRNGSEILAGRQGSTTTPAYTCGEGRICKDSEAPLFDGLGPERTVRKSSQTVTGTLTLDAFD